MNKLVIFSGGQDSFASLLAAMNDADRKFENIYCVFFNYGQKHLQAERQSAAVLTQMYDLELFNINLKTPFEQIGDSELLKSNGDINGKHEKKHNLPASYVPNRNSMFITAAHALAQKLDCDEMYTGVCMEDYNGYPDCRPEYIKVMEAALNIGSESDIRIKTPVIKLTKAQTFNMIYLLGGDKAMKQCIDITHTCYNGDRTPHEWGCGCGDCPNCKLRADGWKEYQEKYNRTGNSNA